MATKIPPAAFVFFSVLLLTGGLASCRDTDSLEKVVEADSGARVLQAPAPKPAPTTTAQLDTFGARARRKIEEKAADKPDSVFLASISFQKYIPATTLLNIAASYQVNVQSISWKVHDSGGGQELIGSGEPLADEFARIRAQIRSMFDEPDDNDAYSGFIRERIDQQGIYVGRAVIHATPGNLLKIWSEQADIVRVVELHENELARTGGTPPELWSNISHFAGIETIFATCEEPPDASIPWPELPASCRAR